MRHARFATGFVVATFFITPTIYAQDERPRPVFSEQWREVFVTTSGHSMQPEALQGRAVGVMEQRGFAFFKDEVAAITAWLTYESLNGRTVYTGYVEYRFEDGSMQLVRIEGSGQSYGEQEGKLKYLSGVGRFNGIDGEGTFSARGYAPTADVHVDAEAEYTLPLLE